MRRTALVALALLAACAPVASAGASPRLSVHAAALIDESTGQLLYEKDPNARLAIASTTKLMTALVTLDRVHRLGEMFTMNNYYSSSIDSQIGLVPGERMSVRDLMVAMLLPSADDAAEDLAYNVGHRSVRRFIAVMNARARELHLTHTHYSTPIGLDTPGNYSSASDLVTLARYLLQRHPFFRHAVALPRAVLRSGNHARVVTNRDDLVGRVPWITGVKTGHTLDAGYVLVGSGKRGGMTLISAVLGTASQAARDANSLALLKYGFENFRLAAPISAGQLLATRPVHDQPGVRAKIIAARGFSYVVSRTDRLQIELRLPREFSGPKRRHAVVGTALVLLAGRPIAHVQLLLAHSLRAVSPLTVAARLITRPITLVSLAVLLGAMIGILVLRRGRARTNRPGRPQAAA